MWINFFWFLVYTNDTHTAPGRRMKVCNRGAQMLVTTAGAFAAFSLMTIAVGTDYWLYSRGVCRTKSASDNDTNRKNEEVLTHSGLWRQCCMEGVFKGVCKNIDHFPEDANYEQDAAEYLLRAVRASSLFPILSVGLLFIGGVCVAASEFYKSRHNVILSAGIFFVSAGLSNIIGIVVYISSKRPQPERVQAQSLVRLELLLRRAVLHHSGDGGRPHRVHLFIDTHRVMRARSHRTLHPSTHSLQPQRYRSRYRWRQGQNRSSDSRSREPSARHGNDVGLYALGRGLPPTVTQALDHNLINTSHGFAHFHNSVIANNTFVEPHIFSAQNSVKSERGIPIQNSLSSEKRFGFSNDAAGQNSAKLENGVMLSQNYKQGSANPCKIAVRAQISGNDIAHTQSALSCGTATRRTTPV